jgi:hypothetical protein
MDSGYLENTIRHCGTDMVFDALMHDPERYPHPFRHISRAEYDDWRRYFVFDGLRDLSYGESFCKYFNIRDNVLRFSQTVSEADEYIERYYLR